jgi:hypothetical protein
MGGHLRQEYIEGIKTAAIFAPTALLLTFLLYNLIKDPRGTLAKMEDNYKKYPHRW